MKKFNVPTCSSFLSNGDCDMGGVCRNCTNCIAKEIIKMCKEENSIFSQSILEKMQAEEVCCNKDNQCD